MPSARILVVEDEAIIAADLRSRLSRMGYHVVAAPPTGAEALALAAELRPDLILLDIVLKGEMDGAQAGERIRAQHDIPVIYLTAYSDDVTLQRVKAAEPYGYILKPFQDREMYTAIEIALHKHGIEKKLRQSEASLRALFGAAQDLIFVKDADLRYTHVNAAMTRVLGLSAEAMIGRTARELYCEADAALLEAGDRRALAGEVVEGEHVFEIGGRPVVLHIVKAPLRDDSTGAIIGLCGIARDITERKRSEERLRRQRDMQHLVSRIARRFIDIAPQDMDAELGRIVKDIGEFAGVDRSYLNVLDDAGDTITRAYEWRADGLEPMAGVVTGMSIRPVTWGMAQLRAGQPLVIHDVAQLPDVARAEREFWASCGVRALLTAPLVVNKALIGILGFTLDSATNRPAWQDDTMRLLSLVAEILSMGMARARAERALRASEERYRLLVNSTDDFIYSFDLNSRYTGANRALCQALGLPEESLIGKRPDDLGIVAKDGVEWRQLHQQVIKSGAPLRTEITVAMPGGATRIADLALSPLRNAAGSVCGLVAISRDVTEHRRAEESLRESQRLFRAVLEDIQLLAVMLDAHGRITFVNDFTCDLTGWRREELLGRNWFDIFTPGNEALRRTFSDGLAKGALPTHGENAILTRQKQWRTVAWNNILLFDNNGNATGITSIGEDVTERRRAEKIQSALYRISEHSALAVNAQALYPLIHRIVADLIDAPSLYIAMREDENGAELVFPYLVDPFMPPAALENLPAHELRRELAGYVMDTGLPMLTTPAILSALIAQNGAEVVGRAPVNWLGVPLRLGGRVHGVLAVQSYSPDVRFGETEKSILNFVSQHIASAIRRKQSESALRASEERFRAIFENSALGIFQSSLDGRLLMANQAYARMFGYPSPEAAVQQMTDLANTAYVSPEQPQRYYQLARSEPGVVRFESEFRRRDGDIFIGDVHLRLVRDDAQRELCLEGFIEDITERKHTEARLRYLYAHDILTGLHNRAYFEEELARLADSRRYPIGVIMVDVDGLKRVNDLLGHAAGDEVLRQVARLIQDAFRAEDVVARIGGDEFAVLLPESDENIVNAAVQRMREGLDEYNQRDDQMRVHLSIGCATAEKGVSILDALKQADARMYLDKALHGHGASQRGRN